MSAKVLGLRNWWIEEDKEGYRDYHAQWLVKCTSKWDGPATVRAASGLPVRGSIWSIEGDVDPYVYRWPTQSCKPLITKRPNFYWEVDQLFTNRPLTRCSDNDFDDPLQEPQKVSGSFVKFTEEAIQDRNGNLLLSSSHEQFRGSVVEFDANRPTVAIEQNVPTLGLSLFAPMVDRLHSGTGLWGIANGRMIKLSNVQWERKIYGTCWFYYTRRFEFDINFKTFDRYVPDHGTKVIRGNWDSGGVWVVDPTADKTDPTDFIRYKDNNGENSRALLKDGEPITSLADGELLKIEKYDEANFLLLGIPTIF